MKMGAVGEEFGMKPVGDSEGRVGAFLVKVRFDCATL